MCHVFFGWIAYRSLCCACHLWVTCILVETVVYVHPVLCLYFHHMWLFIHLPVHTTPSSITLKRPTHHSGELSTALFYNHQSMCQVSTLKIHAMGHHFHARNCRGCGQTSWPCRENINHKIFFPGMFVGDLRNLYSRKFPATRYQIKLPEYVSKCPLYIYSTTSHFSDC